MSSNNNPRNQGSNNQGSQGSTQGTQGNNQNSQGSKSPSQDSVKPSSNTPETANNQQRNQGFDTSMEKDTLAQNKQGVQGGMKQQGNTGKGMPYGDDAQESEQSETSNNANAARNTGTR